MRGKTTGRTVVGAMVVSAAVVCGGRISAAEEAAPATLGEIERLDPAFDALVPPGVVIEKLADGFLWSEGPVWVPDGKYLLFSDIPRNRVVQWKEGVGIREYLKPSGYTGQAPRGGESGSNGLLLDDQGRLVLCQHGDRQIARRNKDGSWTVLADRWRGKRFNSPNDAVYKSNGDLYFTDPPYGLEEGPDDPARDMDFCGVFRLATDGTVTLLTKALSRPNGIAFSPGEETLYVANSAPKRAVWMAFDVKPDGTIADGRVFFDATAWVGRLKGLPDGMKVDGSGNLFATGPGGVNVFTPGGKHLGRVNPGVATANCCFGREGKVLFMTAHQYLCRVRLK